MTRWIAWCAGRVWMSRDHLADERCDSCSPARSACQTHLTACKSRPHASHTLPTGFPPPTFLSGAPQTKTVFCRLMLGGGEKRTWSVWIAAVCTMGKYNIFGLPCFVRAISLLKELLLNHFIKYVFKGQSYITRSCIQFNSQAGVKSTLQLLAMVCKEMSLKGQNPFVPHRVDVTLFRCRGGDISRLYPPFSTCYISHIDGSAAAPWSELSFRIAKWLCKSVIYALRCGGTVVCRDLIKTWQKKESDCSLFWWNKQHETKLKTHS